MFLDVSALGLRPVFPVFPVFLVMLSEKRGRGGNIFPFVLFDFIAVSCTVHILSPALSIAGNCGCNLKHFEFLE